NLGGGLVGRSFQPLGEVASPEPHDCAVTRPGAHNDVQVRVAGVVMAGGDPFEGGGLLAFERGHELTAEGAEVRQRAVVIGPKQDPEVAWRGATAPDELEPIEIFVVLV